MRILTILAICDILLYSPTDDVKDAIEKERVLQLWRQRMMILKKGRRGHA